MGERKYELVKEDSINVDGHTLYRIRALKNFYNVRVGELGGYIEKTANLSQYGSCWAYNNSKIYDNAVLQDRARTYNEARIFGAAWVSGASTVSCNAKVYGTADICGIYTIAADADISSDNNYFIIGPLGTSGIMLTIYKGVSEVMCDEIFFNGTLTEFKEKIKNGHYEHGVSNFDFSVDEYSEILDMIAKKIIKGNRNQLHIK